MRPSCFTPFEIHQLIKVCDLKADSAQDGRPGLTAPLGRGSEVGGVNWWWWSLVTWEPEGHVSGCFLSHGGTPNHPWIVVYNSKSTSFGGLRNTKHSSILNINTLRIQITSQRDPDRKPNVSSANIQASSSMALWSIDFCQAVIQHHTGLA